MKTTVIRSLVLSLFLWGNGLSGESFRPPLPADVAINPAAGRGGLLIVPVKWETGEELPFVVDSGSSISLIDLSLEGKMGKKVGSISMNSWGTTNQSSIYAAPKLYLGGVPLAMGETVAAYDFRGLSSPTEPQIRGMLSIDCLRHYCLQLDFPAAKVRFLDPDHLGKAGLGKSFPITFDGGRPFIHHEGLMEGKGLYALIDSGFDGDGSIKELDSKNAWVPRRVWEGETYTDLNLRKAGTVIGLRFLARHLVTLDFPHATLYLKRQTAAPLHPDVSEPLKAKGMEALIPMVRTVLSEDADAARSELITLEKSAAPESTKAIARKLAATLSEEPRLTPVETALETKVLPLGDALPERAEVGFLRPSSNRIPANGQIDLPLLDAGKIYATGLYAHSPSRYVFNLGGRWKTLRGEGGLHTAFQPYGSVVFVLRADDKEVFRSEVIRRSTTHYEVDLTGVKQLELIVEKAENKNSGNWGLWLDPTLFR